MFLHPQFDSLYPRKNNNEDNNDNNKRSIVNLRLSLVIEVLVFNDSAINFAPSTPIESLVTKKKMIQKKKYSVCCANSKLSSVVPLLTLAMICWTLLLPIMLSEFYLSERSECS